MMKHRILMILIAGDILALQLITLGGSKRNETISACLWSMESDGKIIGQWLRPVVDWLLYPLEAQHCMKSWLVENKVHLWNPKGKS